jgi:hypothetical protein
MRKKKSELQITKQASHIKANNESERMRQARCEKRQDRIATAHCVQVAAAASAVD